MTFGLKKKCLYLIKSHLCFAWLEAQKRNLSSPASIFLKSSSSARRHINRQASTPVFCWESHKLLQHLEKQYGDKKPSSATQPEGLCCVQPNTQTKQKHSKKYGKTEKKTALIFPHSAEHHQDSTCNLSSPIHHWDNRITCCRYFFSPSGSSLC